VLQLSLASMPMCSDYSESRRLVTCRSLPTCRTGFGRRMRLATRGSCTIEGIGCQDQRWVNRVVRASPALGLLMTMSDSNGRPIMTATPAEGAGVLLGGSPIAGSGQMPGISAGPTPVTYAHL